MAGAAPAYQYRSAERAPQQFEPRIRVVPGRGAGQAQNTLPSSVIFLAKVFAVILVVFALLGFVRIGLASATVTTALSSQEISTEIEAARSAGNSLEVRESYLSNPSNIRLEASKLKMAAATDASVITLPKDVVITDEQGNLSLSMSLAAATQG